MTRDRVTAWRPQVPGVAEVLHAAWHDHAYPLHTHATWTLLLVDDGLVGYHLDRQRHAASTAGVTILPPHVAHDGRAATSRGFRKRVVYLEGDVLPVALTGAAAEAPLLVDDALRRATSALDRALVRHDDLEATSRLALVVERLGWHLRGRPEAARAPEPTVVARRARALLDEDPAHGDGITALAARLEVSAAYLVRSFTRAYGVPPHRYVLGRRLDLARGLLLDGVPPADVAAATGFYDQAHLGRHFRRLLATTPGRYQRSARA